MEMELIKQYFIISTPLSLCINLPLMYAGISWFHPKWIYKNTSFRKTGTTIIIIVLHLLHPIAATIYWTLYLRKEIKRRQPMKFRGITLKKGMYVSVAFAVSVMHYTDQKAVVISIKNGVIKRIDNEVICISNFANNTDTIEIIPWEKVIYVIDQHAKTSNKFVNWARKKTANIRNKRAFKNMCKELCARTKF